MNIFIAEDNVEHQKAWARELNRQGHLVISAYTVRAGLELLAENRKFDVFVLDGCLNQDNDADYYHLLEIIKEKYPNAPVIAASRSPDLRKLMLREGCTDQAPKNGVVNAVLWAIEDMGF
jgi:DNA-binding NtrC family response regulator